MELQKNGSSSKLNDFAGALRKKLSEGFGRKLTTSNTASLTSAISASPPSSLDLSRGTSSRWRTYSNSAIEPRRQRSSKLNRDDGFTLNKLRFQSLGLYGRDSELLQLQQAYRKVKDKSSSQQPLPSSDDEEAVRPSSSSEYSSELCLVMGYSGTGKSALVEELQTTVKRSGGFYALGKFDQQRRVEPYTAFVAAFTSLCDDILALEDDPARPSDFIELKAAIRDAVGSDAAVLVDLLPKLELIVGEEFACGEPTDIGLAAAQNRFNFLFRRFYRAICSHNPVVIVIDDLQWADAASLQLMETLVTDTENPGMMFIGCYRDNEVEDKTHPLAARIREIETSSAASGYLNICRIPIGNLEKETVNEFIADVLSSDVSKTERLAELVFKRTHGNVFFVIQFLNSLRDEGLLTYNLGTFKWSWDAKVVRSRTSITDNVAELMRKRIQEKVPREVQTTLEMAACLGAEFDGSTLERVAVIVLQKGANHGKKEDEKWSHEVIDQSADVEEIQQGPNDDSTVPSNKMDGEEIRQHLDMCVDEGLIEVLHASNYRFLHDQIQLAAFSLIPEHLVDVLQFEIGEAIVSSSTASQLETDLFVTVDLLNCAERDISPGSDQSVHLARLNLHAGRKAMECAAYIPAATYLETGIRLLGPKRWEVDTELCLDLHCTIAEAEYGSGNFEELRHHTDQVLGQRDISVQDKLRSYSILIYSLDVQDKILEALTLSLSVLTHLGVTFPKRGRTIATIGGFMKTKRLLKDLTVYDLCELPLMEDENKLKAMEILDTMTASVFRVMPDLFPLIILKMVRWSIRHGLCKSTPVAFAFYGTILCGAFGDFSEGNKMGDFALAVTNKLKSKATESRTVFCVYEFIRPWMSPVHPILKNFLHSYQLGLETGDVQWAMYSTLQYCYVSLITGRQLALINADIKSYGQQMKAYHQDSAYHRLLPIWQFVHNLTVQTDNPAALVGEYMDLRKESSHIEISDNEEDLCRVSQVWLACIYGDFHLADKTSMEANWQKTILATVEYWRSVFMEGLAAFALARQTKHRKQKAHAMKIMNMVKTWAKKGHVNCVHMVHLYNAELAAIEGRLAVAHEEYNLAVSDAGKSGFIGDKALANERAAEFFIEIGDNDWAAHYLGMAHQSYTDWGARAKADHLKEKHPTLF